jgi:hypothetical protein
MLYRIFLVLVLSSVSFPVCGTDVPTRDEAVAALAKASAFFQKEVASGGGYVYAYAADLSLREGEGKAEKNVIWIQPPGTPAVGEAFLDAYDATGQDLHLQGAKAAGMALVRGQLDSGGWNYHVVVEGEGRKAFAYRVDHPTQTPRSEKPASNGPGWDEWKKRKGKGNITTLDDDTTQAATRFVIRLDKTLEFKDAAIHEAAIYALTSLMNTQYACGGWSANYDRFPDGQPSEEKYPPRKASYPEKWSWEWPKDFAGCYVTNDNLVADMIDTMLLAAQVYEKSHYLACAEKAGDFLIFAQMPEPQPAWAQQYDVKMQPSWSRAFEPPAISGGESQQILEALMRLYRATGKKKYLEPIPPAIAWLKKSVLPDGRLARFYELKTNKPLYFMKQEDGREVMTYSSENLPTHYGFIVGSRAERIEREYQKVLQGTFPEKPAAKELPKLSAKVGDEPAGKIRRAIDSLDSRGAWVEKGNLRTYPKQPVAEVIRSQTFISNVKLLSDYVRHTAPR